MARVDTIIVGGGIQSASPFQTGFIPLIVNDDPATLSDSIMSQTTGVITVDGSLSVGTEAAKRNILATGTTTNGNLKLGRAITDGGANTGVLVGSAISVPSAAFAQVVYGNNITLASPSVSWVVAVGDAITNATGIGKSVIIGRGLTCNSSGVVAIGNDFTVNGGLSDIIIIKAEQGSTTTTIGHSDVISIGGASSSAANQCLLGGGSIDIRSLIVGQGDTGSVAGIARTIRCTNSAASLNVSPGDLNVIAPLGTGSGTPGSLNLQVGSVLGGGTTGQTASTGAAVRYSATLRDTWLMVYDVDNATLERVSVGVADSGGFGFKLLRIPN